MASKFPSRTDDTKKHYGTTICANLCLGEKQSTKTFSIILYVGFSLEVKNNNSPGCEVRRWVKVFK